MKNVNNILFFAIIALSSLSVTRAQKRLCNDTLGECVSIQRCSHAIEFNDGSNMFQVRFGGDDEEVENCHYLEVCCDPENVIGTFSSFIDAPLGSGFEAGNQLDNAKDNTIKTIKTTSPYTPSENDIFGLDEEVFSESPVTDFTIDSHVQTDGPDADEPSVDAPISTQRDKVPETVGPPHTGTDVTSSNPEPDCPSSTHQCIPYFYCSADGPTDGAGTLKSRLGLECTLNSEVCCEKSRNIANHKPTECGVRHADGVGYQIANSHDEAQYGEFPWMAALSGESETGGSEYICGGSLIHESVVLTAAHCVHGRNAEKIKVRLGEWDTQTRNEIFPHVDHDVRETFIHPDFGPTNLFNDIALVVLKEPAKLSIVVNTICLPPQNFRFDHKVYGIASGWGADLYEQKGLYRANLKKIDLPIVQLKECQDSLRLTRLGARFKLHPSFMCAGGEKGVDTCTGDGGSPLVYPIDANFKYYYQAGIVAWGIECAKENVPGVYANVAKFRGWIDQSMKSLGFGTESYTYKH